MAYYADVGTGFYPTGSDTSLEVGCLRGGCFSWGAYASRYTVPVGIEVAVFLLRVLWKRKIVSILKRALIKIAGNNLVQKLLDRNVLYSQHLMGIGSGSGVHCSGEVAIVRVLQQRSRPPYCIFDVGANKGQFLQMLLKHLVTGDVEVHCFEPGYETFKILAGSVGEGDRITLNNIGLGKEPCEAILYYDKAGSGIASLTKRNLDHLNIDFSQSEPVKIDTIDRYCSDRSIKHIHLLKIDVEGHEFDVLTGAQSMIESGSVDMVTFEFGGCNIDTRTFFRDFYYLFCETGYKILRITPSGYLSSIASYKEIDEQFRTTNFIAMLDR